ncbi:MAG: hypothetical protein R2911_25895 [Caldilineaceae bacterium]
MSAAASRRVERVMVTRHGPLISGLLDGQTFEPGRKRRGALAA